MRNDKISTSFHRERADIFYACCTWNHRNPRDHRKPCARVKPCTKKHATGNGAHVRGSPTRML